ncbi:GNAT family N-acetyltransferase [Micromonospora sp. NPDC050980]|uniref:GNAT family N-acetyltransferase n=1 Tax=Micromonospora sp. NPDC050980 TaxID=3155161 RepID=UPI0033EC4E9F
MSTRRWRLRQRYAWSSEGGRWAALHGRWDSRPGRRYPRQFRSTSVPGDGASVAYHGLPEGPTYALPHLFDRQRQRCASPVAVRELPARRWPELTTTTADLLVVGCSARQAARLPRERALVLPFRINLVIDVDPDVEVMRRRISGNERRQFAKLRRQYEWEWETSTDPEDLAWFYERMHQPTMAGRHGEGTRSTDLDTAAECLFARGHLFFVAEGGKRVAGVLCRRDDGTGTLTMRLLGVLDGDETHYRSGAVKAVYYLAMEWACANGIRRLDLSGGEPFPGTGVFQFKRRFHPTVTLPEDHFHDKRLWLRIGRDTPAVRDLLVDVPFFAMDATGGLEVVYFGDANRPARTDLRAGAGLSGTRTIDLDEFLAGAPT